MKKILFIILALVSFSCKAQIIPLQEHINYLTTETEIPDGVYFKDVDNLLDKYVGTWKGTFDGKNYEFIIEKYVRNSEIRPPLKFDKLRMRYKITEISSGTIIADTTTLPDESKYVVNGNFISPTGSYIFSYIGFDSDCGQNGSIYVKTLNNTNNQKVKLFLLPKGAIFECTNPNPTQVFPINPIEFIKQ